MKFKVFSRRLQCFGRPCIGKDLSEVSEEIIPATGVRFIFFHNKSIDEIPTVLSSEKLDLTKDSEKFDILWVI